GDVSGRGVPAATAMASLRFAIHYAARESSPSVFLPKLSTMRRLTSTGLLATVLCAVIDLATREVSLTSAGHLPPLVLIDRESYFLAIKPGLPLGIDPTVDYESTTYALPAGATLLAYTDGLVCRRLIVDGRVDPERK